MRNRSGAQISLKTVWLLAVAFSTGTIARAQAQPATNTPAQPQQESVSEAARKAKAKKAEAQPGKVYTDEDLSGMRGTVSVVGPAGATNSKKTGESSGQKKKDAASKSENEKEAYWRGRANAIHEKMAEVDKEMDKVREEIKTSGGSGFDPSSGLQRNVIYVDDRNARLQALEKKKADLEEQMDQLREEGRKAGALPAWFR